MKLIPLYGHGWESNCYLLIDRSEALLVDAGVSFKDIMDTLEKEGASLKYIVLTHGHFDHTFSVDTLREQTGAHLLIHEDDAEMLADSEKSALYYFSGERTSYRPADRLLRDGDSIPLGDSHLRVLHTPGHSRGSLCLLTDGILFSGDTLFDGGYGRYDLYGGDAKILAASLRSLRNLDPNLIIHPGHGGPSSLGRALDLIGNFIL